MRIPGSHLTDFSLVYAGSRQDNAEVIYQPDRALETI
jgi:hypothetical protein